MANMGHMKTTLDIHDELLFRAKRHARADDYRLLQPDQRYQLPHGKADRAHKPELHLALAERHIRMH